jgi:hypothetical protein
MCDWIAKKCVKEILDGELSSQVAELSKDIKEQVKTALSLAIKEAIGKYF